MSSAIDVAFNTTSSDVFKPWGAELWIKKLSFEEIFLVFTPNSKSLFPACAVILYVVTLSGNVNVQVASPLLFVSIVSKYAVSANLDLTSPLPSPFPPVSISKSSS